MECLIVVGAGLSGQYTLTEAEAPSDLQAGGFAPMRRVPPNTPPARQNQTVMNRPMRPTNLGHAPSAHPREAFQKSSPLTLNESRKQRDGNDGTTPIRLVPKSGILHPDGRKCETASCQ